MNRRCRLKQINRNDSDFQTAPDTLEFTLLRSFMLFYFKARSCTIILHITVWWNRHCAIHFYFMFSLFLRTKIAFTSWKINERNYWRTITSKKSVICLIKVNYASYNYTQCIRTWHLLPSCGRSKYLRSKIKGQNLFSYHSQFLWNFKFVILKG